MKNRLLAIGLAAVLGAGMIGTVPAVASSAMSDAVTSGAESAADDSVFPFTLTTKDDRGERGRRQRLSVHSHDEG